MNLFQDIAAMDHAFGRVNMRRGFATIHAQEPPEPDCPEAHACHAPKPCKPGGGAMLRLQPEQAQGVDGLKTE